MAHARQQIREAVIAKIHAIGIANAKVMKARTNRVDPVDGPVLIVFAPQEQSDVSAMGSAPPLDRTLSISLEAYVKGDVDIEDDLDDLAVDIETAFGSDPKLGGLIKSIRLTSTESDIGGGSEQRAANMQMVYEVRYRTKSDQPSILIQ